MVNILSSTGCPHAPTQIQEQSNQAWSSWQETMDVALGQFHEACLSTQIAKLNKIVLTSE